MKVEKFEIVFLPEALADGKLEGYEKVCRYLLQKFCGDCEIYESFGLFEGVNGGTGRERLFDTSTEDRVRE